MRRASIARAAAGLLLVALAGCQSGGPRARAESQALRRQAETLRRLIAGVEAGEAFSPRHVTLGIGSELVRDLVQLTLPIETELPPDLRARLETAAVEFQHGESRVTLRGRVSRASVPGTFADLTVRGGLHRFEVGEGAGHVTARVALERLEVRKAEAEGLRREILERAMEELGAPALDTLAAQIPPITIPVRFEREIATAGASAGPFELMPGRLRVGLALAEVVPLGGRLWVQLDVRAEPAGGGGRGREAAR